MQECGPVWLKRAIVHAYLRSMGVVAIGLGIYEFLAVNLWLEGPVISAR